MEQKPSIGRVAHHVDSGGVHLAATISDLHPDDSSVVDLHVLVPDLNRPVRYVPAVHYDERQSPITWHWPERV